MVCFEHLLTPYIVTIILIGAFVVSSATARWNCMYAPVKPLKQVTPSVIQSCLHTDSLKYNQLCIYFPPHLVLTLPVITGLTDINVLIDSSH